MIRPYNSSCYAQGKILDKKLTNKPQEGDTVLFFLDHGTKTISVSVNGIDQGVCFTNIPSVAIYPGKQVALHHLVLGLSKLY